MVSLKSILRIMWAAKRHHILNILGLSIGLSVVFLISLYIGTELSFDKHVENYKSKYRILKNESGARESIFPYVFAQMVKNDVPSISSFCLIHKEHGSISIDQNNYMLDNVLATDGNFASMFDLNIIEGETSNLLKAPNTCIVSESTAKKLFGEVSAVGKSITLYNTFDCEVKAVYADLPTNSHLKVEMALSIESWRPISWQKRFFTSWGNQGSNIYIELQPEVTIEQVEKDITQLFLDKCPWAKMMGENSQFAIGLQNVTDIHLNSTAIKWDTGIVKNDIATIRAFGLVMILVLLLACFNYINLSTAASNSKRQITNVLSALGAKRSQLFTFNLVQTVITVLIAFTMAYFLVYLVLPYFAQLVELKLKFSSYFSLDAILLSLLLFGLIIGLSGLYPALFLSSGVFTQKSPTSSKVSSSSFSLRPILVTAQFVVAIFLMVTIFSIRQQINLLTSEELGFDKQQLVQISLYKNKKEFDFLSQEFMKIAGVEAVTSASNMPCEYINNENSLRVVGSINEDPPAGCLVGVESNYFDVMNTKLVMGEGFNFSDKTNSKRVLVNQTTLKLLNLEKPMGTKLQLMGDEYEIAGVVEDVQYRTLREPALPVLYNSTHSVHKKIAVRLKPGNHVQTLAQIKEVWKKKYASTPFVFKFFDNKLEANYRTEINQLKLFNLLVIVGGIIVILGMIGLVRFITDQKNKEIGVRKVNGAKISEVLMLLNQDFVKWVVIAFVIACPLAWYAMMKWLESFAYKAALSWWIFAVAGVLALSVAIVTVSWQSWRAATRNPVDSLRYE